MWHTLDGDLPAVGESVHGDVDWERRHQLMRTHSALHVLCGVIWKEWGTPVTGGNMEPLEARMDFEFDPLPEGLAARVTELVNAEISADRPIEVSFLPGDTDLADAELIRTNVRVAYPAVSGRSSSASAPARSQRPASSNAPLASSTPRPTPSVSAIIASVPMIRPRAWASFSTSSFGR